jgi:cytosine/adenosine deaminase-related metal-dependent hydrolase
MAMLAGLIKDIIAVSGCLSALLGMASVPVHAQSLNPTPMSEPDDGAGRYALLLITGATIIDGGGAPPVGPRDILIANNRIQAIAPVGSFKDQPVQRTIDAKGMYVMPGFVDTHGHLGDPEKAPNSEYAYKLWLAHGVTSVRGVGFTFVPNDPGLIDAERSARGEITAPRLFAYGVFGAHWGEAPPTTPEAARNWVRWAKQQGYLGVKFIGPTTEPIFAAALDETKKHNMGSIAHIAQTWVADINGAQAAQLGLGGITHFYGHFESLLDGVTIQKFPIGYNYADEQDRFARVAELAEQSVAIGSDEWNAYLDILIENKVTMSPTFNIYSAGRDLAKAQRFIWHDRYTLPSLMKFYTPSTVNHGSFFFDWTTAKEIAWRNFYQKWFRLVRDYVNKGGRVTVGSDPGFIYQTWGFAYVGELEMLQEAGLTPLEVMRAATIDGARDIYEPLGQTAPIGMVRAGMLADLVITPEDPLQNFKTLYGTGHMRLNKETGTLQRVGRVRWTIKDGIVYDAHNLLADVEAMVQSQSAN